MGRAVAMAPERDDVRALSEQIEHDIHGGDVLVGVDYRTWRRQLPDWREASLDVRQNTVLGPLVARGARVERGPLSDERFELEAYPAFRNGYLALGAGVATSATVYARTTGSAELFGMLTDRVEGSFGYRRMNFDRGVDLLGGSVSAYAGQFLLGTRVTQVLSDGGTSVQLSARRFLGDDGQYVGVKAATGSVPVALRTPTDFEVRFSQSASVQGRFLVRGLVLFSAEGELGREGLSGGQSSPYSAIRVGIGLRY
jgi:YaiO family outer membrane protein